jgi:hypothetical protein
MGVICKITKLSKIGKKAELAIPSKNFKHFVRSEALKRPRLARLPRVMRRLFDFELNIRTAINKPKNFMIFYLLLIHFFFIDNRI